MPSWRKVIVSGSDASLNSLNVATNVVAQSFTGSLFGTSSYALQALSSSYATTASYTFNAISSSFASTASYVNTLNQDVRIVGRLIVSASSSPSIDARFGNYPIIANDGNNGGFSISSYGTALRQNYLQLYGANGAGMSSTVNGNLSIGKYTSDILTASIYVSSSGNVGFGTNTPNSKVDIVGNATITGSLLVSSSLMQYSDNTDVDNGVETVMSVATGSYRSAFFDYVIASGSNARSGTVMAVWNGASVQYTEASTNDIGSTVNINLDVTLSGANVLLRARANSDNWSVKTLARLI